MPHEARQRGGRAPKGDLYRALVVTAEVMGHELSELAAEDMARELACYPAAAVAAALSRCKRELTGRLTLSAVLQRIDDGHPGAEEAWALCPRDEAQSVVWTDEIAEAFSAASPLLAAGDQVGARMAFKEIYGRALQRARDESRPARYWPSLGHDASHRASVLLDAVMRGRLAPGYARNALVLGSGEEGVRALATLAEIVEREKKRLSSGAA